MENHWTGTNKGKELVKATFIAANLPEVEKKQLETGTYTNQQIAEMCPDPTKFIALLMKLPESGNDASRRSVLSFAVDMI